VFRVYVLVPFMASVLLIANVNQQINEIKCASIHRCNHAMGPVGHVPSNLGERWDVGTKYMWSSPTFATAVVILARLDANRRKLYGVERKLMPKCTKVRASTGHSVELTALPQTC